LRDENKTKKQLIEALRLLRKELAELKGSTAELEMAHLHFQSIIDNVLDPITVVGIDCKILFMNKAAHEFMMGLSCRISPVYCHLADHRLEFPCHTYGPEPLCPLKKVQETGKPFVTEHKHRRSDGEQLIVEIMASPLFDEDGSLIGIVKSSHDITNRKLTDEERLKLISDLQDTLSRIITLKGIVSMCAWCKKIRNEKGQWESVDTYIETHSEVKFTHGICFDCMKKVDTEEETKDEK
jgi:signal transduction histidine kinase